MFSLSTEKKEHMNMLLITLHFGRLQFVLHAFGSYLFNIG